MSIRVLFSFYSIELRKMVSYRATFWLRLFSSVLVPLLASWYLWDAIFRAGNQLTFGGFSFEWMVFYYLLVPLVKGISVGNDDLVMSQDIYTGGLTKYILYPVDFFAVHYVTKLADLTFGVFKFLGGIALYAWIIGLPEGFHISFTTICTFLLFCFLTSIMHFLMVAIIEMAAFWIDIIWNLHVMLRFIMSFLGGAMLPLSLLPEWGRQITEWLPFQYIYWYPINILLGRIEGQAIINGMLGTLVWISIFALIARWVWNRGKYQYTGVGI